MRRRLKRWTASSRLHRLTMARARFPGRQPSAPSLCEAFGSARQQRSCRQTHGRAALSPINVVRAFGVALFLTVHHHVVRLDTTIARYDSRTVAQTVPNLHSLCQIYAEIHPKSLPKFVSLFVSLLLCHSF